MTYARLKLIILVGAILINLPAAAQVLKTGVDATFAPHAMVKLGGGLQGFNIDLGYELARRLGKKIEIEGTEFSGLIPGMNAGKYDFVLAPVTATPERAKAMLFTEGYLNTDFTFVEKNSTVGIESLEDLFGKTIAVNKGSAYEAWSRKNANKYGFEFDVYGSNADAVLAVQAGRADAGLAGNGISGWIAKQNPEIKTTFTISTGLVWSLAFRTDDKAGRDAISMVVKCMKKDKFIANLVEKWFGFKPGPKSAAVSIAPGHGIPGMNGYDATLVVPKCS
ncbi:MAG: polar amino acid ABC transporter substrate-binding protein [Candidatus Marinimicrobia bacterium]|nr:polar amino acid ABC transporter substrate-binding protein [Candidatus Neomarinimicrobiota bacterium]